MSLAPAQIRIARPTANPEATARFYELGVQGTRLGEFEDHAGYSGVMIGLPDASVHLELVHGTAMRHKPAPTPEDALVLYYPDQRAWAHRVAAMLSADCEEVDFENPYWNDHARIFRDPDGYLVIVARDAGLAADQPSSNGEVQA